MNCANHPDIEAVAFCRECGKPMCRECQRPALGSVYCEEHAPGFAAGARPQPAAPPEPPPAPGFSGSPYQGSAFSSSAAWEDSPYRAPAGAAPDPSVHPALALILGFFPGVGAIYNGQYAKGLIHAVVFGLLVSIVSNVHNAGMAGLVGVMIAAWVVYQMFEAYHTARKRRYGLAVEEFSSLFEMRPSHGRFPAGAIVLIGIGFILLLDTTDILSMEQFARYWPALLILIGLYLLYARLSPEERRENRERDAHGARR